MFGRGGQPVAITVSGKARGATLAFSLDGRLRVAVIVKATFALADGLPMIAAEPQAIAEADIHPEGDASRSLLVASDLAPYRAKADVTMSGSAYAPSGAPAPRVAVRLMIGRGSTTLVDKRVVAIGPPGAGGPAAGPAPFTSMPLLWELAACGPSNPSGVQDGWPRLCDPWSRPGPVGVAPIAASWPTRRAFGVAPVVEGGVMRLRVPDGCEHHGHRGFPWDFFQCAPLDQRVDYLRGDEWVVVEGVSADKPRIHSVLPNAQISARVSGDPEHPQGQAIPMVIDGLHVDAENRLVSIVWRGSFGAMSEANLPTYGVYAKVSSDAVAAPSAAPAPSSSAKSKRRHDRVEMQVGKLSETLAPDTKPPSTRPSASRTFVGSIDAPPASATPFKSAFKPASAAPAAPADLRATPFARAGAVSSQQMRDAGIGTTLPASAIADAMAALKALPFASAQPGAPAPPAALVPPAMVAPAQPPNVTLPPPTVARPEPPRDAPGTDRAPETQALAKSKRLNSTMAFDPSMLEKLRTHSPMPFAAVQGAPPAPRDEPAGPSPLPFAQGPRVPSPLPFAAARSPSAPPPVGPSPLPFAPPERVPSPLPFAPPERVPSPLPFAVPQPSPVAAPPPAFVAPPPRAAALMDDAAPETQPVIAPPVAEPGAKDPARPEAAKLGAAFLAAMKRASRKPATARR